MPYVLGNAVDLAWCLKGFADGQECFVLIKKGLQMQEYQFSRKGRRVSSGMEITLLFSRTRAVFNSAQHQLCPLLCLWGAPDPHLGDLSSTWVTFTGGSELIKTFDCKYCSCFKSVDSDILSTSVRDVFYHSSRTITSLLFTRVLIWYSVCATLWNLSHLCNSAVFQKANIFFNLYFKLSGFI